MGHLEDLSVVSNDTEMVILFNNDKVTLPMEAEHQTWKDNDVYNKVEHTEQTAILVRWVVTVVPIAWLVARGFEENTEGLRKDSPTCSKGAVRLLLPFAS